MKKYYILCLKRLNHGSAKLKNIKNSKGAILLEFSFSIPTLIIVLFFILDVPQAYRISSKLQKTSELFAEMILNVNRQKESRAITIDDLKNISKAIGLTFTDVLENKNYPFYLSTYLICIKGKNNNKFEQQWSMHIQNDLMNGRITTNNDYDYSNIQESHDHFLGNIENFKIFKDEIKLIIETVVWYNDKGTKGFNHKFYILNIPGKDKKSAKTLGDRNAIITPPYGLVTEEVPK